MFDFKFNWDDSLSLGIDKLDLQHRELFRIGRDIEQLLLIHCIGVTEQQLMTILYELRDFITYHFYEEEALMKKIHYPDIQKHIQEHKNFSKYINGIDYTALCASPYVGLKELRDHLVKWIFEHLVAEDQLLGNYYKVSKVK